MPVKSSTSSLIKWPDRPAVDRAVRAWAKQAAERRPEVSRIGYFGSYAREIGGWAATWMCWFWSIVPRRLLNGGGVNGLRKNCPYLPMYWSTRCRSGKLWSRGEDGAGPWRPKSFGYMFGKA